MNNTRYISIILCTYNDEKYIGDSIQSILNQTYPYFELIVVNDGSTDSTRQIVESFEDERIVLINKTNSGLPDSLNTGIDIAKYDWIARMDGDDIAESTRLENQIKYIDDSVDVIGGQAQFINENGVLIADKVSSKPLNSVLCKLWLFLGLSPLIHPSVVIRKSLFQIYGGYDENFLAAQDLELWSRLMPTTKIINIKEKVLFYRTHVTNISNSRRDLQIHLTFLGFLKYVLKIRRQLSKEEFNKFEFFFKEKGLIDKNRRYFDKSHNQMIRYKKVALVFYYLWRLYIWLKYRLRYKYYNKMIFSCASNL